MDFAYKTYFKIACNTGYETLIYDAMIGDATLFQRAKYRGGWSAVQAYPRTPGPTVPPPIFRTMSRVISSFSSE